MNTSTSDGTDGLVSSWSAAYASAHNFTGRKHLAIERELFDVLDACMAASAREPRHLRPLAVKRYIGHLYERRRKRSLGREVWRLELLEWIASQDSFLHHAST